MIAYLVSVDGDILIRDVKPANILRAKRTELQNLWRSLCLTFPEILLKNGHTGARMAELIQMLEERFVGYEEG